VTRTRTAGLAGVALLLVAATGALVGPSTPQAQRRALSGDLTKSIDAYTGDEFFNLVTRLNYTGGQQRARRCRGNPNCTGTRRTNVRVDAVGDADSLGAATIPQYGVVAMRAIVRGPDEEARYGMQSMGPDSRYAYFLIILPGPDGPTWRLEEMSVQGTTRTHRMLRTGRVVACPHTYVRGARADFRTCAQAAADASGGLVVTFASLQGVDPPIWYGCATGCCTAE